MFIKQSDLFWGLDKKFVASIMEASHKECYKKGTFLFREGDDADKFYILLKGRIRLNTGNRETMVHTVCHAGETFGWSGLVGREHYSASAECSEDVSLVSFEICDIHEIIKLDPANGMLFYKHLAYMLGNRLIKSYQMIHPETYIHNQDTFGTGQMIQSELELES